MMHTPRRYQLLLAVQVTTMRGENVGCSSCFELKASEADLVVVGARVAAAAAAEADEDEVTEEVAG